MITTVKQKMYEFFLRMGKWTIQVRSCYPCPEDIHSTHGLNSEANLILEIVHPDDAYKGFFDGAKHFIIYQGSVDGLINSKGNPILVRVWFSEEWWASHGEYGALELMLARAFYTLSKREEYRYFLLHASAVAKDNIGYLFLGPPGSGKTTVASMLSRDGILLHDESIILYSDNEHLRIQGGVFHTRMQINNELVVPLNRIFFLKHDKCLSLQRMKPSDLFIKVLKQTLLPLGFDLDALLMSYASVDATWNLNVELINNTPGYILKFSPKDRIWSAIESIDN